MNDECDQDEAGLALEEGSNVNYDDSLNSMASNHNVEVQTRRYSHREGKSPERFSINSIVRVHDDEPRMPETLSCEDESSWKEAMCTDLKILKDMKRWELIPESSETKLLHTKFVYQWKLDEQGIMTLHKKRLVLCKN